MGTETFLKLRYVGNYYTAIFRKMGDMYESFVRAILAETLGLSESQMQLVFQVEIDGKLQARTLDAQIDTAVLSKREDVTRVTSVIHDIDPDYNGGKVGFEVRCCYQIG